MYFNIFFQKYKTLILITLCKDFVKSLKFLGKLSVYPFVNSFKEIVFMSYDGLITNTKKEADFDNLQKDIGKVENFIDRCLKIVLESFSSSAERDYNVTSM